MLTLYTRTFRLSICLDIHWEPCPQHVSVLHDASRRTVIGAAQAKTGEAAPPFSTHDVFERAVARRARSLHCHVRAWVAPIGLTCRSTQTAILRRARSSRTFIRTLRETCCAACHCSESQACAVEKESLKCHSQFSQTAEEAF